MKLRALPSQACRKILPRPINMERRFNIFRVDMYAAVPADRFQYMHSLNLDIDKMEDEIKSLQAEASKAVAENKGKDDHWQQLKHNTMARVDRLTDQDRCAHSLFTCPVHVPTPFLAFASLIKVLAWLAAGDASSGALINNAQRNMALALCQPLGLLNAQFLVGHLMQPRFWKIRKHSRNA